MIKKIFSIIYINDLENNIKQASILCLENFYFNIFKIELENSVNNEDRLEKIEDRLENIFPKYNSEDFILNYEYIKKDENNEEVILYILNWQNFYNSFSEQLKNNNIISIIPSFFLAREYSKTPNFYNFDISSQGLVISKYTDNKIEDIIFYKNENSFIIDNIHKLDNLNFINTINLYLKNIEAKAEFDIIFTGEKIDFSNLDFDLNKVSYFFAEKINFLKYPNFLPKSLKNKNWYYYLNLKYLFFIFICVTLTSFFTIFLYYKIAKFENILNDLENENNLLEEYNQDIRLKIAEFESNFESLEKELAELSQPSFQVNKFLDELKLLTNKSIKINSIEYDGEKIISVFGNSSDFSKINNFFYNIQNSKMLNLENYDYILKKENSFEFKVELSIRN